MTKLSLCAFSLIALAAGTARADDIDVDAFEYVDVIETADGSILKGVIVEQEPGVKYKLATSDGSVHVITAQNVVKMSKTRNKDYRGSAASEADGDLSASARGGDRLPRPYAKTGIRGELDLTIAFPNGDIDGLDTSFAPTIRVGYEQLFGNFGLSGGGMGRFTYWMLPGDSGDALWTLETQVYGRAAFHIGRVAPYAGLSIGTDLNYAYINSADMSDTALGFGTNLGFGVQIAATPTLTIDLGGDYHPATDSIPYLAGASIEYFALRLGAHMHQ